MLAEDDPLGDILVGDNREMGQGLEFMGVPLLLYNIRKLQDRLGPVEEIIVPPELQGLAQSLGVEFGEGAVRVQALARNEVNAEEMPSSAFMLADGPDPPKYERLSEPWRLLQAMGDSLGREVTKSIVSPSAEIADTAVITGPCVISDGVHIDDFCKLKGPVFIGPGTRVWTGSLVRESMIGADCEIGFGCEIARTYMLGRDRTAHHDVILDSVLGWNVWMGAFIGTTNMLLNNENVRYKRDGGLVDTGMKHFGAVFGHDSAVGAGTMILPGRFIPPGSIVQAGTVYSGPADVKAQTSK